MQVTQDAIFAGRLRLWQPARGAGYRFNLDPILLAGFARPAAHVLELGAGCGVLGLALLHLGKARRLTAVEIQPEMAELVARNARENGLEERVTVLAGDLRGLALPAADHVVFNPPYFRAGAGRGAPNDARDVARHERHGGLADFVERARSCLGPLGFASAVVPIERAAELTGAWSGHGGAVLRRRSVCSRAGDAPRHLLFEGGMSAGATVEEPELVVHRDGVRDFTDEVAAWVEGTP
ncbi:MAG: tRNA1(Val) (adenine(37)-N6)-methyltransferase [Myxococcota bacterium]